MRALVTGFGPFGSIADNPSTRLAQESGRPFQILEVAYAAVDEFLTHLPAESFDLLVMLGVAATSRTLRWETVAKNWVGATADVRGAIVGPGPIDLAGPPQILIPTSIDVGCARATPPELRLTEGDEASTIAANFEESVPFRGGGGGTGELADGGNPYWERSTDAGEYLCNYLYYRALQRFNGKHACFIHVPPFTALPESVQWAELDAVLKRLERGQPPLD